MTPRSQAALVDVDRALRQMRRFFEPPSGAGLDGGGGPGSGAGLDGARLDASIRIEASTVLVLEAVVDAGASTVRDVARELDVAHSTASRLVTRAEKAGVVRREPSPTNRRETLVRVTDLGTTVRENGLRFRLDRLTAMTAPWSPAEVETFARLLERFAAAATDDDQKTFAPSSAPMA